MSTNLIAILSGYAVFVIYWVSYIVIRPKVVGFNFYGKLFLFNLAFAILIFSIFTNYLVNNYFINNLFWINTLIIIFATIIHHLSIIDKKHFSERIHGKISHLFMFIPFLIFCLVSFFSLLSSSLSPTEYFICLILFILTILSAISGIIAGVGKLKLPW